MKAFTARVIHRHFWLLVRLKKRAYAVVLGKESYKIIASNNNIRLSLPSLKGFKIIKLFSQYLPSHSKPAFQPLSAWINTHTLEDSAYVTSQKIM